MRKLALPIAFMISSALSLFVGFTILRSALAGFFLYYVLCCLVLPTLEMLGLRRLSPRVLPELLGFNGLGRRGLSLGLLSGFGMTAIMLIALALFKNRIFGDGRIFGVLREWGASGGNAVYVYIAMLAFNGAVEEFFWRGFLYDKLKYVPNRFLALGVPLLFFGAQHVFVVSRLVAGLDLVALILVGIFGAGAVWSLIRERTGSVLPCAISHTIVTAGYMGALLFFTAN